jgi:hypothetical protein
LKTAIGSLTRRVPAETVINALPPKIRNRKPPKDVRTPRVVELLPKAIEWPAPRGVLAGTAF